jgi:hypothetical protein
MVFKEKTTIAYTEGCQSNLQRDHQCILLNTDTLVHFSLQNTSYVVHMRLSKDLYIVHPDMPSYWDIWHWWCTLDDSWELCPQNLVGKNMLDDCLQLGSENLYHMEMGYMDLYFQQLDWIALEIERIIPICNMHCIKG